MKLSDENRDIFLTNAHAIIEDEANFSASKIEFGKINQLIDYPPNGGLTDDENKEILKLKGNPILKSALRKVIASSSASVFFSILNVIDGTSSPEVKSDEWDDVMLVDMGDDFEEGEMLHDEFYSTYWKWKSQRLNKNWKLDLLD